MIQTTCQCQMDNVGRGWSFELSLLINSGADPGLFLGGGALVSCSTSTPINHIVFSFFAEYQLY